MVRSVASSQCLVRKRAQLKLFKVCREILISKPRVGSQKLEDYDLDDDFINLPRTPSDIRASEEQGELAPEKEREYALEEMIEDAQEGWGFEYPGGILV